MAPDRAPLRSPRRGSITLVSLCLTTVLGIALGSYLALCLRSTQFSTRQLNLEKARELAQTGLEEALWALNQNTWNASGPDGTAAWSTSGADRTVTLTYALDGQASTGSVTLTIANYASTGPTWPTITAAATLTLSGDETFTKTLQATAGPLPVFAHAVASSDAYVAFTSGGTVDSWNSDPDNNPATAAVAYSFTSGAAGNYAAVVAGNDDGTYGVVLTQAEVRGYVATSGQPISYSTSGSPPGKILGPTTASSVNVDPARIGKSAFIAASPVVSVSTPATSGSNYGGLLGLLDLVDNLTEAIGLDLFKVNGLTIDGGLVYPNLVVNRPVKLIVNGDLKITTGLLTNGKITINEGGSLQLFVSGDVTIEAHGIDNQTKDPRKLAIYCTNSSTTNTVELNTDKDFYGVIFSENKPIDVRRNLAIYGALLSRNYIRFTASAPAIHYDTALRLTQFSGIKTPYVTRQMTEL